MTSSYEDVPMFDVDLPVRGTPPRARSGTGRPRWSKYRPKDPLKCDDCMRVLFLAKGEAPAALPARWRRAHDGADLLLCIPHAQERRDEDGLERVKD